MNTKQVIKTDISIMKENLDLINIEQMIENIKTDMVYAGNKITKKFRLDEYKKLVRKVSEVISKYEEDLGFKNKE